MSRCIAIAAALLSLTAVQLSSQNINEGIEWSPDKKLYAIILPGKIVGKRESCQRFEIHVADSKPISMVYVGESDPAPRGCERWGWIDSKRIYCEGSLNPSTGVYLYYDARPGRQMGERWGNEFTWSPDKSKIANFGNVPHFSDWDRKSDSLEIENYKFPKEEGTERHIFRSAIYWSPDNKKAAIVDHQLQKNAFFLIVISAETGEIFMRQLKYNETVKDEWPGNLNYLLKWNGAQIIAHTPAGAAEEIVLPSSQN